MTTIAWDGKNLAADRQATVADMSTTYCKIQKLPSGDVVASTGCFSRALLMQQWYEQGANPAEWPSVQTEQSFSRLIVAKADGTLTFFEWLPVGHVVLDPFMAFGSGRDYAMGAMAMGATAERAIEVASRFDVYTGGGVDVFHPGVLR